MSAISVGHLAPDAPAVDVTAANGSVVLADNVTYRNATDYVTVPAGNYTAEIRPDTPTNDGEVLTTVNVSLESGTAYSALAVGYLDPAEAPADTTFEVVLTEDATQTIHLPGEEPPMNETPTASPTPAETETPEETEMPAETEPPETTEMDNETEPVEETEMNETAGPDEADEPAGPAEPGEADAGEEPAQDNATGNATTEAPA
jgi:outer membrane biosynthesis protein TonB